MPIHCGGVLVHAMSETELSRVRTELDPTLNIPNRSATSSTAELQSSGHGHLGDIPLSTHRQNATYRRLQSASNVLRLVLLLPARTKQRAALLGDVSQPLMASTGVSHGISPT